MKAILLVSLLFAGALAAPKDGRIVGGLEAEVGQFPYQISLKSGLSHICGGSIVHETKILTAAHCLDGSSASRLSIVAGTNLVSEITNLHSVQSYVMHAQYSPNTYVHDIGVIHIQGHIEFSVLVQPIALNTEPIGEGVDVVLSGWGRLNFPGLIPQTLQYINLVTTTNQYCADTTGTLLGLPVEETHICTFTVKGEGGCKGDSGGPLVVIESGEQGGVVSWGYPCAKGVPDVYTRVSKYVEWIKSN